MKKFFYLSMLFLIIGLWLGINTARNQPLFSNPLAGTEVMEKAAEKVERAGSGAKNAVKRTIDETVGN